MENGSRAPTAAASSIPARLVAACAQVRPAAEADAVAGVTARYVAEPSDTAEAGRLLGAAAELGLAVVARGCGSRLDWAAAPTRADLVVDTRRMNRVLEHAAGDLVVRVQAGLTLSALADVLAPAGQRLAVDPPSPAAASEGAAAGPSGTVGGLIATGVAGPLRLRYGGPRDLLIGITVVRADGAVAKSGGKVVKNVAGYDLGKLFAGSYGTLGLITEAVFRLHPRPETTAYLTTVCPGPDDAQRLMTAVGRCALAPSAAEIDLASDGGVSAPISAGVMLEGDADSVAERTARLAGLIAESAPEAVPGPVGPQPPSWWSRAGLADDDSTLLRITLWPGELAAVLAAVGETAAALGEAGRGVRLGGSAAAGVLHAVVPGTTPPASVTEFVADLRDRMPASPLPGSPPGRGSVTVLRAPAAVADGTDLLGPVPSLRLMRAVKDQFDPEHRMAPGRLGEVIG